MRVLYYLCWWFRGRCRVIAYSSEMVYTQPTLFFVMSELWLVWVYLMFANTAKTRGKMSRALLGILT